MKTYSQDLREKMLAAAAVDRGMPRKEGADRRLRRLLPGDDAQTVALRRRRQTGSATPKKRRGPG